MNKKSKSHKKGSISKKKKTQRKTSISKIPVNRKNRTLSMRTRKKRCSISKKHINIKLSEKIKSTPKTKRSILKTNKRNDINCNNRLQRKQSTKKRYKTEDGEYAKIRYLR